MGGRRHRQNHNELQNLINGKRKGKATQSPTGLLSKRSKRPDASNSPAAERSRASSSEMSGAPTDLGAVSSVSAIGAEAPTTVSTGAVVPTSTLANDKMDVDPQAVDAELRTEVETGQINDVGTIGKEPVAQAGAPAPTPSVGSDPTTVVHPPAYASDSILPVGKHASEVGEDTPEPTTEVPNAE